MHSTSREQVTRLCPARYCPEARIASPLVDRVRGLFYDVGVGFLHGILPSSLRGELPPIGDRWGGFGDEAGPTHASGCSALGRAATSISLSSVRRSGRAASSKRSSGHSTGQIRAARCISSICSFRTARGTACRRVGNTAMPARSTGRATVGTAGRTSPGSSTRSSSGDLLQVGYTDLLVGRLLDSLEESGLYDRALIVLAADHGVSFHPGGWRRLVTTDNAPEVAGVPFFVKYPGQRAGRVDERAARTVDILPTIADVVGVKLPWKVDGRSLRGPAIERDVEVVRRSGTVLSAQLDTITAGIRRAARRNASLFGTGSDSLYQLVRARSSSARPSPSSPARTPRRVRSGWTARRSWGSSTSARSSSPRESSVRSTIPPQARKTLAIAVNGRIAAVTRRYTLDGRERFAALAPESAFRNGRNDVDVYEIEAEGAGVRLVRLGGTARGAASYALARGWRCDRASLRGDEPLLRRVASTAASNPGSRTRERCRSGVGAVDLHTGALPDQILLFSGHDLLYAGETTIVRWDVDQTSGRKGVDRAGWVATLPAANLDARERPRLRSSRRRGLGACLVDPAGSLDPVGDEADLAVHRWHR